MTERFKTIYKQAEAEIVEKKSRFIATAAPVQSEEEALAFIAAMRKKHWNATHNVFAYRVGESQRYSDDGEPSGTAGMPVLDILRGMELQNTAVNITRHFGGTLLGAGGLVRAYSRAAKEGLEAAGVIEKLLFAALTVTVSYPLSGKVQHTVSRLGHVLRNAVYTDTVTFSLLVEACHSDAFVDELKDITGATALILPGEPVFGFWLDGKLITNDDEEC